MSFSVGKIIIQFMQFSEWKIKYVQVNIIIHFYNCNIHTDSMYYEVIFMTFGCYCSLTHLFNYNL